MELTPKLAILLAAAGLVTAGLTYLAGGFESDDRHEPATLPPLTTGTVATYEASGDYTGLVNSLQGYHPPLEEGTILTVTITDAALPDAQGDRLPTQLVHVATPNKTLTASARTDQRPFLFTQTPDIWWPSGLGPTDPVTHLDARAPPAEPRAEPVPLDAAFGDVFLFENETIPAEPTAITTIHPLAKALSHDTHLDSTDTVHTEPPRDDDPPDAVRILVESFQTTHAEYVYTDDCPLPLSVRYPQGQDVFEAERVTCHTTPTTPANDPTASDMWPEPVTGLYERTFPGDGDQYPLAYRPAIEFFLDTPNTMAWTQQHPDWRLTHAVLAPDEEEPPQATSWSWGFVLCEDGETTTGWVTQAVDQTGLSAWRQDPSPPTTLDPLCHGAGNQTHTPSIAGVDTVYEVYDALVDDDRVREDAQFGPVVITPSEATLHLPRCPVYEDEQNLGLCYQLPTLVRTDAKGHLETARLESEWFSDPLEPLQDPGLAPAS